MNNTNVNSRGVGGDHRLLLLSFLILIIAVVFESFTNYSNYVIYPIWVFWLAYIAFTKKRLPNNEIVFVRVSFVLLCIMLIYKLIGLSTSDMRFLLRNINWIMTGVVSTYAIKIFSKRQLTTVYYIMTIAIFFLLLIFFMEGRVLMAMGNEEDAVGVANAWYGSLFMLISGISLIVVLHVKSFLPRIIAIVGLLLSLILNLFILQRATNVIFTIAEIGLILVFLFKRKSIIIALSIVMIGFALFALSSNSIVAVFDWLAAISPSERLSERFNDISMSIAFQDIESTSGSFARRHELAMISWDTFTSSIGSFLFGVGEHTSNNNIIGNHNFFIDILAQYGIIGGILVFIYFKKQYQLFISYCDQNKNWTLFMQCTIVFVFYVLRNYYGSLAFGFTNLLMLLYFPWTFQILSSYMNKTKRITL